MTIEKKLLGTSPSGGDAPNVEDVFSTYLYEGNSSTQTITNGIDLAGEGGMVWTKNRTSANSHSVVDTERGIGKDLRSDTTAAQVTTTHSVRSFNSNGYSIGAAGNYDSQVNQSSKDYASWTFRKAPRFFDVVTYTGNATAGREIAHNLGVAPGMIFVKGTFVGSDDWSVYHRSIGNTGELELNNTSSVNTVNNPWNNTTPTSSVFTLGTDGQVNASAGTYVAYLFAHDPDGENDDGMIACGSYTGTGVSGLEIDIGWEPQYLLVKNATRGGDKWIIVDSMRGIVSGGDDMVLAANTSAADGASAQFSLNARGFTLDNTDPITNSSGHTFIYMAIRGPMMVEPEAATDVFAVTTAVSTSPDWVSGFAPDMGIYKPLIDNILTATRLRQGKHLRTNTTSAEFTDSNSSSFDYSNGFGSNISANQPSTIGLLFKRAKGFFDVVTYTGNGTAGHTVNHSLGVVPEMIWVKNRVLSEAWAIQHSALGTTSGKYLVLNTTAAQDTNTQIWSVAPTDADFTVNVSGGVNENTNTFIAYLFATLAGVSKVGNYTGNGSSQNIACGFSAGARFVLIKRTDSTGDWYFWDTLRGIVAGNDPHLSLNTTAAQVTTDDSIDPQSAGFTVNQVTATNINVTSATYIFLAIA